MLVTSKHHPNGEATSHLDNTRLEQAISRFQVGGDPTALEEIITLTEKRALTLIRFYRTTRYRSEDELLSDINFKLLKSVGKFDRAKGSAFTFLSQVIMNTLRTSVTNARAVANQYVELDEGVVNKLRTYGETESQDALDDFAYCVKCGAKTTLTLPSEVAAQRWYIESFCHEGFDERRPACANAAMAVFSLGHERSRELYDLTMLEVRRVLYDDAKRRQPTIVAGRLFGTRLAWMSRYCAVMNEAEFTKFVTLMRGLSPFVLLLVDPQNKSRRQDRCAAIGRRNIEFVLNGHPDAVRLF